MYKTSDAMNGEEYVSQLKTQIYEYMSYQNPSYLADIRSKSFSGIKGLTTIPQYYILCNVYYYENCVYLRNGLLWRKSFVF